MSVLMHASNQWASRPADQRFASLAALHAATSDYRSRARVAERPYNGLQVRAESFGENIEPVLVGEKGTAHFSNWSFGQLCARIGAPASYLRALPARLVAENLNHGLKSFRPEDEDNAQLMFTQNGGLRLAALTSPKYSRIWNSDVTSRLIRLTQQQPEWQPAPAAFDGSRGLYASDHDMFAFLVDNERRIFEKGPEGGLGRGFFVWNSEVGAASFGIMTFFYEYVCGNHRVWGASGVHELRIRHVGEANDRAWRGIEAELVKYAESSAVDDEAKIESARRMVLGKDKDEVLDKVFGLRVPDLSRRVIGEAYDLAVQREDRYGDPRTVWALTGGMTEIARDLPNADDRVKLDRAAGKVLQIAF